MGAAAASILDKSISMIPKMKVLKKTDILSHNFLQEAFD